MDPHEKDTLRLKRYWLVGPGRAKWATWTQLYHHLRKYISPPERAKATAAKWYYEATGMWPGSDLNRVAHGKKPRGKRIGRG